MQFDWLGIYDQLASSGVTACFTVLTGVSVFVLGQWVIKFFIEPIHKLSGLFGEIAHSLVFYANAYGHINDDNAEFYRDVAEILRKQASDLRASVWTIRWYRLWQFFGLVPKKKDALRASENLIGLSNSVLKTDNGSAFYDNVEKRQKEIKKLLKFN